MIVYFEYRRTLIKYTFRNTVTSTILSMSVSVDSKDSIVLTSSGTLSLEISGITTTELVPAVMDPKINASIQLRPNKKRPKNVVENVAKITYENANITDLILCDRSV